MIAIPISITSWIALGLPPACAYLSFSLARDRGTDKGRRKVWLWLCLTILGLCAIYLGMETAGRAFAATDCVGDAVFEGCETYDASWGKMLFGVFHRFARFFPAVCFITLILLAAVAFRMSRRLN